MKLLTHNMLTSNVKGVKIGYPLLLKSTAVEVNEVDFNPEFIVRMIPRIQWPILIKAMTELGFGDQIFAEVPEDAETNEEFLQQAHHALFEIEVKEGTLECPESHRIYQITNGVPNMLLSEEEEQ